MSLWAAWFNDCEWTSMNMNGDENSAESLNCIRSKFENIRKNKELAISPVRSHSYVNHRAIRATIPLLKASYSRSREIASIALAANQKQFNQKTRLAIAGSIERDLLRIPQSRYPVSKNGDHTRRRILSHWVSCCQEMIEISTTKIQEQEERGRQLTNHRTSDSYPLSEDMYHPYWIYRPIVHHLIRQQTIKEMQKIQE